MDRTSIGGLPPTNRLDPEPLPDLVPGVLAQPEPDHDPGRDDGLGDPPRWELDPGTAAFLDNLIEQRRRLPLYVCASQFGLRKESSCGHVTVGDYPDVCPKCGTRRTRRRSVLDQAADVAAAHVARMEDGAVLERA